MGVKRSHRDSSSSDEHSTSYPRDSSVESKIVQLDTESAVSDEHVVMKCSLPPHDPLTFASIEEHDVHYHQFHMNRCSECQRNFPDQHYLHLHIAEYHDPIIAAKRDQGEKTYACLLPDCDRLCSTPQKRRLHCIDKHQFPREYDFIVVKDGIDRRSSMLIPPHRRRSSTMSSAGGASGAPGRRRGESSASTAGENMDVVRDQDEDNEKEEQDEGEARRYPIKLHGRGGFSHGQKIGRAVGRGDLQATASPSAVSVPKPVDPMDNLASSMSALKFIPHSRTKFVAAEQRQCNQALDPYLVFSTTTERGPNAEPIAIQTGTLKRDDQEEMHRRRSSVWRPTLDRDCTTSAVLVALQLNAERSSLKASRNTPSANIDGEQELDASEEQGDVVAPPHRAQKTCEVDMLAFRFPPLSDRNACHDLFPESETESSSEHTSPASEATLFDDDLDVWPISQLTDAEDSTVKNKRWATQSHDRIRHHAQERIATPVKRQGTRHWCRPPSSPVLDGLNTLQQVSTARGSVVMDILTAEEREMEYKHRHTFIGTASLDEFLELLEISSAQCVSQRAVVRAFVRLAWTEHLYARQYSTRLDGWGLVARTTPDYKDIASADYLVQSRVKLGAITLRQFLSMIPFDQDNQVAAAKVVEAFCAASHMDAQANMDARNKARAFRSWLISHKINAGCC